MNQKPGFFATLVKTLFWIVVIWVLIVVIWVLMPVVGPAVATVLWWQTFLSGFDPAVFIAAGFVTCIVVMDFLSRPGYYIAWWLGIGALLALLGVLLALYFAVKWGLAHPELAVLLLILPIAAHDLFRRTGEWLKRHPCTCKSFKEGWNCPGCPDPPSVPLTDIAQSSTTE